MSAEERFFETFKNLYTGVKIEGVSGYINLLKIKSAYFKVFEQKIREEIETRCANFPEFKEELFDKLYSFFKKYIDEKTGSIFSQKHRLPRMYMRKCIRTAGMWPFSGKHTTHTT